MKTIKQIADEIGVSKQAVAKKIKTEPLAIELEKLATTVGGKLLVSEGGERLIKSSFLQKKRQPVADNVGDNYNQLVVTLNEQIQYLKKQIDVKDVQIADLSKSLDQQQQLNLKSIKQFEEKILLLEQSKKKWWQKGRLT